MKLVQEEYEIEKDGDLKESAFGINLQDSPFILDILRNKLYTDKIGAVIREYATNAYDAQVAAGNADRPFDVVLPNALDLSFSIRDYGIGLSENDIREIYVKYGASTKRMSNDYIGQLGLGCKSAFAYTDIFQIYSFFNGIEYQYSAYIDETKIGSIAKIQDRPTTEPNGVKIIIPVKRNDVYEFSNTASRILSFFKVKPNVKGNSQFQFKEIENSGSIKISRSTINSNHPSGAIMGNVYYPLDNLVLNFTGTKKLIFDSNVIINLDIGEASVAANREGLEYKDDIKKIIEDEFSEIEKYSKDIIQKDIDDQTSLMDARCKLYHYRNNYNYIATIAKANNFTWNNIDLKTDYLFERNTNTAFVNTITFSHLKYSLNYKKSKLVTANSYYDYLQYYLNHGNKTLLLIQDNDFKSQIKIHKFLTDNNVSQIHVLKFNNDADRDEIFKEWHLDHYKIEYLSKLPVPPTVKRAVTKNRKHHVKCFNMNEFGKDKFTTNRNDPTLLERLSYWNNIGSTYFKENDSFDITKDTHMLYCVIDRFDIMHPDGSIMSPQEFLNKYIKNIYNMAQDVDFDSIIFVKVAEYEKNKAKFATYKNFFDYHKELILKFISSNYIDIAHVWLSRSLYPFTFKHKDIHNRICNKIDDMTNIPVSFQNIYNMMNNITTGNKNIVRTNNLVDKCYDLAPTEKIIDDYITEFNQFIAKYPMLKYINDAISANEIIEYIELVDKGENI